MTSGQKTESAQGLLTKASQSHQLWRGLCQRRYK